MSWKRILCFEYELKPQHFSFTEFIFICPLFTTNFPEISSKTLIQILYNFNIVKTQQFKYNIIKYFKNNRFFYFLENVPIKINPDDQMIDCL